MVWFQCIYFCLLTLFFYRKGKGINAAFTLSLLYSIVAIMAVAIDILDLYNEYGINRQVDSITGTLFYCIGLTFVIWPFSNLQLHSINSFAIQNHRLFNITCYVICICTVLYVAFNFSDIVYSLVTDADEVKSQHYDDLANGPKNGGQALWMYPINILSSAWCFILVCWFISVLFLNKGILFNGMLLLCSMSGVLKGSLIAGRAAIIYWIFCFITLFSIFIPIVPSYKMKKRLILSVLIPIAIILFIFTSITISRFAYRGDNEALYSFIGYAGQQYNNFCAVFEYGKDLPFTIERIMPITYKYVIGGQFDLMEYYDSLATSTGIKVNNFYTLLGGLYLTTGGVFTIFYIAVLYLFNTYICKKASSTMDFSYFVLLSICILIPIKGMFEVPFPSVGDSLVNITLIGIFVMFRYSFVFKKK